MASQLTGMTVVQLKALAEKDQDLDQDLWRVEQEMNVHGPDARTLPLDGVTPEALQQLATDPRFDDAALLEFANRSRAPHTSSFTTEQACQHIFMADGMPSGWTDVVSPINGTLYSRHRYRHNATGAEQELPPAGTRSIAEVLREKDSALVGEANRFISHYWQMSFRDVVSAVSRRVKNERADGVMEPIYLWFDVISIDEHHAESYAKGFSTTFMDAVKQIGHVYLIADVWSSPSTLTRIWCLWELYCCHVGKAALSVCLTKVEEDSLVETLEEEGVDEAITKLSQLDCSRATSTRDKDRIKIGAEIKKVVGFGKLNGIVQRQMRQWIRATAIKRLDKISAENNSELLKEVALMHLRQGEFEKAKQLHIKALDVIRTEYGEDDLETAAAMCDLAEVYIALEMHKKAQALYEQALQIEMSGAPDPDPEIRVAKTMHALAGTLQDQKEYAKAKELYYEAIRIKRENLGPEDLEVATSLESLGSLLTDVEEYSEAYQLFEQALDINTKRLPPQHPDIAVTLQLFAELLEGMEEYDRAGEMYEQAIEIRAMQLGLEHPDTIISLTFLTDMVLELEDYERATLLVPQYEEAIEISQSKQGLDGDLTTATVMQSFAKLLGLLEEYRRAVKCFTQALKIREANLGAEHEDTAETLFDLGDLYWDMERPEDALPCLQRALAIREKLDPESTETADSAGKLGLVLQDMGRYNEALPLFVRALEIDQKELGSEHTEISIDLRNLASLLEDMGRHDEALPLRQRARQIASSSDEDSSESSYEASSDES